MPEGLLIILKSANGRDGWEPVLPADVPEWVKNPDVMARLVAGDMVCDPTIGEYGSDWYRAERMSSEGENVQ